MCHVFHHYLDAQLHRSGKYRDIYAVGVTVIYRSSLLRKYIHLEVRELGSNNNAVNTYLKLLAIVIKISAHLSPLHNGTYAYYITSFQFF